MAKEVVHCQVLVLLLLEAQWYSSESEPPGKRNKRVPISRSDEMVAEVSKYESQTAVLTANHRESAVRTGWSAFTTKCVSAGAGAATNWISSR